MHVDQSVVVDAISEYFNDELCSNHDAKCEISQAYSYSHVDEIITSGRYADVHVHCEAILQ